MRAVRATLTSLALVAAPVAAVAATACVAACSQPVIPTSAISAAEVAAQTAATVVSSAQAAWPIIYALVPPAQQAAAQDIFNKAVFAANHAVLALNDAIGAAIAANNPSPDFSALLSQLGDAVNQVVSIVQDFRGPVAADKLRAAGSGVDAVGDMRAAAARIAPQKR